MSTAVEIASLVATAASLTAGTDLFANTMPATPDECVAVYEYAGLPSTYVFGSPLIDREFPRIQIVCRGEKQDISTPRETAETIYQAIGAVANQSVSGTRYHAITPLQPPFLMGHDANGRPLIAFNCQVDKEPS